jgi:biotin synthase
MVRRKTMALALDRPEILRWLTETRSEMLNDLWREADRVRKEHVGDEVHLRGLVEISNHCLRQCHYCGLRANNREVTRYRMTADEIIACAKQARDFGYGTVVLQAGEDEGLTLDAVAQIVKRIKAEAAVAVTLSLGERTVDELRAWHGAGADRYLLRFETSNSELFSRMHPPRGGQRPSRMDLLRQLGPLGYEVGSGVMIGIPGQSYEDLANDLELFRDLDLDMIGVGPFIAHPATPFGQAEATAAADQVPASELMTYKMIALARLLCPDANIPSTTALATLNIAEGRELGLRRGANIVMPNMTPPEYRVYYEIYPAKACIRETSDMCNRCITGRIEKLGRAIGKGEGASPNMRRRSRGKTPEMETLGGFPNLPAMVRAEQSSAAPHAIKLERVDTNPLGPRRS